MEDLLIHGLQDIYYAEQQITESLPTMIEKATNRDLGSGLIDQSQKMTAAAMQMADMKV